MRLSQQNSKKKIHDYLESIRGTMEGHIEPSESSSIREVLADMISRNPLNSELLRYRGSFFAWLGELERALSDFSTALDLDEHDTLAYIARSECYARMGRSDLAIEDADHAVGSAPNDPSVYIARARLLITQAVHKSLEDISHAVKLCTKHDDHHPLALESILLKSEIERRSGSIPDSLKTLKVAEAIDSMHPVLYQKSAQSLLKSPDSLGPALEAISYSISLDPNSVESRMIKARIEACLGEPQSALTTLSKAFDLCSNDEAMIRFIHLVRGHLCHSAGEIPTAAREFETCLSISQIPSAVLES